MSLVAHIPVPSIAYPCRRVLQYYFNTETNQQQWEKPAGFVDAPLPRGWEERFHPDLPGVPYVGDARWGRDALLISLLVGQVLRQRPLWRAAMATPGSY